MAFGLAGNYFCLSVLSSIQSCFVFQLPNFFGHRALIILIRMMILSLSRLPAILLA